MTMRRIKPEDGPRGTFRIEHPETGEATPAEPLPPFHIEDLREHATRELHGAAAPQTIAAATKAALKLSFQGATRGRPLTVRMQLPVVANDLEPGGASNEDWLRSTQTDLSVAEREGRRLHVGMRVGDWIVVGFIASGGFAEVYKIRHHKTGEMRALKILSALHACRAESVARLANEARTLLRLREIANVVYVFEVFETLREGACIVMELLDDGMSLQEMLTDRGRLDLHVAIEIMMKVAQTLATVHSEDVVHRDLSPGNVYVRKRVVDGVATHYVQVLDLGCAKTPDGPHTSSKVATVGTWRYISPEQVGRGEIGPRSDLYALASMLYHLIEGEGCFDAHLRRAGEAAEGLKFGWHIYGVPRLPDWMPVRLWNDLVARNLEKDPKDRHPDVLSFARDLHAFWRDLRDDKMTPEDRTPVADAGSHARKPPQPLPTMEPKPELPDVAPVEIGIADDCPAPSLLVADGPPALIGKRYRIGRHVVLGRRLPGAMRTEADLAFEIGAISARHVDLQLILEGQAEAVYTVTDLGGQNGTELNGVDATTGVLCPPGVIRLAGILELELCAPGVPSLARMQRPFAKKLEREREARELNQALALRDPAHRETELPPKYDPPIKAAPQARPARTLVEAPATSIRRPPPPRWLVPVLVLVACAITACVMLLLIKLHVIGADR